MVYFQIKVICECDYDWTGWHIESSGDKEVRKPESHDLKTMQATLGHKDEPTASLLEKLFGEQMDIFKKSFHKSSS